MLLQLRNEFEGVERKNVSFLSRNILSIMKVRVDFICTLNGGIRRNSGSAGEAWGICLVLLQSESIFFPRQGSSV